VRSIVRVRRTTRRMVVSGLKEWLWTLGGLREMLVRHELMLKMTGGMLGKGVIFLPVLEQDQFSLCPTVQTVHAM
jgi:hypothetical protein